MADIAPTNRYPERGRGQVDAIIASNTRRRGPSQASEQSAIRDPRLGPSFESGACATPQDIGSQQQEYLHMPALGRSPLADGCAASGGPTWDAVSSSDLAEFSAAAPGERGDAFPHPWPRRAGSGTPLAPTGPGHYQGVIAPTSGFDLGERPNTSYPSQMASNPRNRRNVSDVTEAL